MRSIRFPEELLKKLEQLAEQSDCSLNMQVIRMLSAQIEQEEKKEAM
jgi:predicted transcriptional regulator